MTAYAITAGTINESYIYVKGYGGEDKKVSIKDAGTTWKKFTIKDIQVTDGKCEVGIYSDAKGGAWIKTDDFSLVAQ